MSVSRILKFLKTKSGIIITIIVIGGGAATYFIASRDDTKQELLKAEHRDVTQIVAVTGTVKAASIINLEFLAAGRVAYRPRQVGDHVSRGETLLALDAREIDIQIAKAKATLDGNKAKLDQLKAGATPETVRQLENAVTASYLNALAALDTAITKSDKSLSTLRADIFLQNNKIRSDFQLALDTFTAGAENEMAKADADVAKARAMREGVRGIVVDQPKYDAIFSETPFLLGSVRNVLVTSSELLRRVVSAYVTQSTINTYSTDISTVRSEHDTAIKTFADAIAGIQAAKDVLRVKQEPPRAVDIAVLEAGVKTAEADLALLEKQKGDTILVSPVDGVVTNLGYEISEVARPNTTAVSLISISGVEIEANVPEVDVAKVAVGNPVSITLDAIPGETFTGKVTHIDPAETVVDGVTNYKIKISFDAKDPRIKSGVTANLDIETLRKPNTLTLPQFGIVERDEGKFVRKLVNGEVKEFPITAGIRSSDGYVEILSGVSEGDEVLNAGLKTN